MNVRIGILGTSRVASYAVIQPAARSDHAAVTVVGGRDLQRTRDYAAKNNISKALPDYRSVVESEEVDAVYVPLPNALHHEWTLAALAAGKHVLCEKPLAANHQQAVEIRDAAAAANRVVMVGFHYRHHPLMDRLRELLRDPEMGELVSLDAAFCLFWPKLSDIRYSHELAGGALMDIGCYPVNLLRVLTGTEATVRTASSQLVRPHVDGSTTVELEFEPNISARIRCSLRAWPWQWRSWLRVQFSQGEVRVLNPFVPHAFHRLQVRSPAGRSSARVDGPTTYEAQLNAFTNALSGRLNDYPDANEAIGDAKTIDAIYAKAGVRDTARE